MNVKYLMKTSSIQRIMFLCFAGTILISSEEGEMDGM